MSDPEPIYPTDRIEIVGRHVGRIIGVLAVAAGALFLVGLTVLGTAALIAAGLAMLVLIGTVVWAYVVDGRHLIAEEITNE